MMFDSRQGQEFLSSRQFRTYCGTSCPMDAGGPFPEGRVTEMVG